MQQFYTEVLNRVETAIHELEIEPIAFYSRQKPLFLLLRKPVRNLEQSVYITPIYV